MDTDQDLCGICRMEKCYRMLRLKCINVVRAKMSLLSRCQNQRQWQPSSSKATFRCDCKERACGSDGSHMASSVTDDREKRHHKHKRNTCSDTTTGMFRWPTSIQHAHRQEEDLLLVEKKRSSDDMKWIAYNLCLATLAGFVMQKNNQNLRTFNPNSRQIKYNCVLDRKWMKYGKVVFVL